ncbi:NLI interacting factor-like phosphatase-domain-containing protein [Cokeromyces recurvatus]|uniref:NLI interacting factor-like phosphatase-domain-containing protein n=1 Tax=Cokeromyces recurvatus TaxID=90255 RepID=UPI00221F4266|nr:NLI interacting factor-like phosphatase-domain-containing protein [Cokeromyces recurvatus]KAI7907778.1 NLI interacting factor-like phosphatase-domain-containing protein [Cokeromyces recurvatus]
MTKRFAPKKSYFDIVHVDSKTLKAPLKNQQLLILDLNGTLVSRVRKRSMYVRPYSNKFFNYIFDNFEIMIWSSAQPDSVHNMCRMFPKEKKEKISLIWDRKSFGLSTRDYHQKVLTIKDLDKVWEQFGGRYDATNTILLDDSPKKTQLQPYNSIHPKEFDHNSKGFILNGDSELLQILDYLKVLQFQSNVANYIKNQPYKKREENRTEEEEESHLVEFYAFSDDYEKPENRLRQQKKKGEPETITVITDKMSNLAVC